MAVCLRSDRCSFAVPVPLAYDMGSVNVVFLPGNLVQADGFQKVHDILSAIEMRCAIAILAHEDYGHVGEEAGEGTAGPGQLDGIACHLGPHGNDGKGHPLLNDDGSVYGGHGCFLPAFFA